MINMKNQVAINPTSTLQEWTNFLTILNEPNTLNKPLLKKTESPSRMVYWLTKQFPK